MLDRICDGAIFDQLNYILTGTQYGKIFILIEIVDIGIMQWSTFVDNLGCLSRVIIGIVLGSLALPNLCVML